MQETFMDRIAGHRLEVEENGEEALPTGEPRLDVWAYNAAGGGACLATTYETEMATLIAASPALLRAAEAFMANLWKCDAVVAMGPEIEDLRDAIAQARGE